MWQRASRFSGVSKLDSSFEQSTNINIAGLFANRAHPLIVVSEVVKRIIQGKSFPWVSGHLFKLFPPFLTRTVKSLKR